MSETQNFIASGTIRQFCRVALDFGRDHHVVEIPNSRPNGGKMFGIAAMEEMQPGVPASGVSAQDGDLVRIHPRGAGPVNAMLQAGDVIMAGSPVKWSDVGLCVVPGDETDGIGVALQNALPGDLFSVSIWDF